MTAHRISLSQIAEQQGDTMNELQELKCPPNPGPLDLLREREAAGSDLGLCQQVWVGRAGLSWAGFTPAWKTLCGV